MAAGRFSSAWTSRMRNVFWQQIFCQFTWTDEWWGQLETFHLLQDFLHWPEIAKIDKKEQMENPTTWNICLSGSASRAAIWLSGTSNLRKNSTDLETLNVWLSLKLRVSTLVCITICPVVSISPTARAVRTELSGNCTVSSCSLSHLQENLIWWRYQSEKYGVIPCVLPCRKGSKIAPQLTRGPSLAPQSPTRRIPNSTRACRRPCIFSPVSTALGVTHFTGRQSALQTSRRSFRRFLARPEKALLALPPPAAGSGAQSRPRPISLLSALNLLTNSSRPPAPPCFSPHLHTSRENIPWHRS